MDMEIESAAAHVDHASSLDALLHPGDATASGLYNYHVTAHRPTQVCLMSRGSPMLLFSDSPLIVTHRFCSPLLVHSQDLSTSTSSLRESFSL